MGKKKIKYDSKIKDAIIDFFIDNPDVELGVQEIYHGIQDYIELTEKQREIHPEWKQPRFWCDTRWWLSVLKKEGFLKHPGTKKSNRWVHVLEYEEEGKNDYS